MRIFSSMVKRIQDLLITYRIRVLSPTDRGDIVWEVDNQGDQTMDGSITMVASETVDGVDVSEHDHSGAGEGSTVDHGSLNGLNDDDHTQYVLDAGDTMTGTLEIDVPTATDEGLILKTTDDNGAKNLLEIQNSSSSPRLSVASNGDLSLAKMATYDFMPFTAVDTDIVSAWDFDEGTGVTAADKIGSNDLTLNSDAWTASARVGANASTDYGSRANLLATNAAWTITGWIYSADYDEVNKGVFSVGDTATSGNPLIIIQVVSLQVRLWAAGNYSGVAGTLINSTWHYISLTFDGVNTYKLYLDGVLATSRAGIPSGQTTNMYIGNGFTAPLTSARFDEWAYFDAELDSVTIKEQYFMGLTIQSSGAEDGLLTRWKDVNGNIIVSINNQGGLVVNEQGNDTDSRFEGSANANLLYVDAGNDRIGVKTDSPSSVLNALGTIKATGGNEKLMVEQSAGSDTNFTALWVGTTLALFQYPTGIKFGIQAAANQADVGINGYTLMSYGSTRNTLFGDMAASQADIVSQLGVITSANTKVALKVRGAASQSANLQEWQDSADAVLASISAAGAGLLNSLTLTTDLAVTEGGTGASTAADARTNLGLVAGGAGDVWVEKAGDTMTGALILQQAIANHRLTVQNTTASATTNLIGLDLKALTSGAGAASKTVGLIIANLSVTDDATRTGRMQFVLPNNGVLSYPMIILGNKVGFGLTPTANMDGISVEAGLLTLKETTTPTADTNYGKLYTKNDNDLYFQDGAGVEHPIGGTGLASFKSYNVTTQGLGAGVTVYAAGFYEAPAADANLTQIATTQTLGTANISYAAHAFVVAAAAGVTDGSDLVLTVSGISITDAGVRNAADSEVVVADCTAASQDDYYETTKKWLGQVTFTLSSTAGGTFNFDFNYGFAKYEDFGNRDFTVTDFEAVGYAGANETNLDVELCYHSSTGWTYSAAAFTPGPAGVVKLSTDHSTDDQLANGEHFAYKRTGLSTAVTGSGSEGVLARITTTANNAVEYMNVHIGVEF